MESKKRDKESQIVIRDEFFPKKVYIIVKDDCYILSKDTPNNSLHYKPEPYGYYTDFSSLINKLIKLVILENNNQKELSLKQYLSEYRSIKNKLNEILNDYIK